MYFLAVPLSNVDDSQHYLCSCLKETYNSKNKLLIQENVSAEVSDFSQL